MKRSEVANHVSFIRELHYKLKSKIKEFDESNISIYSSEFVSNIVRRGEQEYVRVLRYLWAIIVLLIGLVILDFYLLGLNFDFGIKFLIVGIVLVYFASKVQQKYTSEILRKRSLDDCKKSKAPFFYKWFGRPTLSELAIEVSDRYLFDSNKRFTSEIDQIWSPNKAQFLNSVNSLDSIFQTCSDIGKLCLNGKYIQSNNVFAQSYIFDHLEMINVNNENVSFPIYSKLGDNIFIAKDGGNENAVKLTIRDIVVRNLLGIKLSKVKLTMYDPVLLGAFFSDFHQLDKEVTGGQVFNSTDDLNEILDNTIRHISMVVQKILTNVYIDLNEFNEQNPEISEPYRLLIINDFPRSFDDYQLEKINQILESGPKCGVNSIIISDNISRNLKGSSVYTILNTHHFSPIFDKIEINHLIKSYNEGVIATGNVVVDFNSILIKEDQWWTFDSSSVIELPLGKKGRDIQSLKFDNKDDNQALMIGKPGSGKSNLLHVIILSAITKYGPDDLEIYLIDFKGGVEFMCYSEYYIPQLKTVALESDREFGLSVIDGLEKELLRRETLFRNNGVQNIEQYNRKNPGAKVPRILFIVDEFQEFFKEEDELKHLVSLKYDTIIRKGRAFGINSLFSSQTLEGHSIPRSTKELIDIRIALMCGDNDVREIMDDKNLSAKDLSRPGEAIYNAENGKSNGNQRFQAVFAHSDLISSILNKISVKEPGMHVKDRFVFRGDLLSTIDKDNHPIKNIDNLKFKAIRVWIGEPVSMDPDCFFDLKLASAQNVLAIGGIDEVASVFGALIFSIKAQYLKIEKIYVVNPLTDVDEGYEQMYESLGCEDSHISFRKSSQISTLLDEINELILSRKEDVTSQKNVVCIINSINKIPILREDHVDSIGYKLINALHEGAEYGIHFILHCDGLLNLKRTHIYDNKHLFNHRILFGMNEDAYYELIGNNSIRHLKSNRMIYYSDELGIFKIIKPYELKSNR